MTETTSKARPDLIVDVHGDRMAFGRTPAGFDSNTASYNFEASQSGIPRVADSSALCRRFSSEGLGLKYLGQLDNQAFGRQLVFVPTRRNGVREVVVGLNEKEVRLDLVGDEHSDTHQERFDKYASKILPALATFAARRVGYMPEKGYEHIVRPKR